MRLIASHERPLDGRRPITLSDGALRFWRPTSGEPDADVHVRTSASVGPARDRALADTIEAGKQRRKPKHEAKARQQLENLRRSVDAAAMLEGRANVRLDKAIMKNANRIQYDAEQRHEAAMTAFSKALDDLEHAAASLSQAQALKSWAVEPARSRTRSAAC
jgi:hypothetical protein